MTVSYFPGCTLSGTAKEYGDSVVAVTKTLGIELKELSDWNCCGSSSAHATNDALAVALAARNLLIADKLGQDVLVPCAACFQRLKRAEKALKAHEKIEGISDGYKGNFSIIYASDYILTHVKEKQLLSKVKKTLEELNPVCYYGCLSVRPPAVTDAANPENPVAIDKLMKTLGANVKNWSFKTNCCGGDLFFTRPDVALKMTTRLLDMALEAEADCIVSACPLCQLNLDRGQTLIIKQGGKKYDLPVFYFTELMGLAFGDPNVKKWLSGHEIDPLPLLTRKGLI